MRTLKNQKGLSLIEVTIMLLVLMLLTGVLAPSIFDFVKDAQWVKVKEDCEAIALTVARLHRDVGCISKDNSGTLAQDCSIANKVDVLYSDGAPPIAVLPSGWAGGYTTLSQWPTTSFSAVSGSGMDSMENQFVLNTPSNSAAYAYPQVSSPYPVGPQFNLGWRGAYMSPPIGPDPWGNAYLVNTAFMNIATDAATGTTEGQQQGQWHKDVFCLSPGPNRKAETAYATDAVARGGDDFITVISGGTR